MALALTRCPLLTTSQSLPCTCFRNVNNCHRWKRNRLHQTPRWSQRSSPWSTRRKKATKGKEKEGSEVVRRRKPIVKGSSVDSFSLQKAAVKVVIVGSHTQRRMARGDATLVAPRSTWLQIVQGRALAKDRRQSQRLQRWTEKEHKAQGSKEKKVDQIQRR